MSLWAGKDANAGWSVGKNPKELAVPEVWDKRGIWVERNYINVKSMLKHLLSLKLTLLGEKVKIEFCWARSLYIIRMRSRSIEDDSCLWGSNLWKPFSFSSFSLEQWIFCSIILLIFNIVHIIYPSLWDIFMLQLYVSESGDLGESKGDLFLGTVNPLVMSSEWYQVFTSMDQGSLRWL